MISLAASYAVAWHIRLGKLDDALSFVRRFVILLGLGLEDPLHLRVVLDPHTPPPPLPATFSAAANASARDMGLSALDVTRENMAGFPTTYIKFQTFLAMSFLD